MSHDLLSKNLDYDEESLKEKAKTDENVAANILGVTPSIFP